MQIISDCHRTMKPRQSLFALNNRPVIVLYHLQSPLCLLPLPGRSPTREMSSSSATSWTNWPVGYRTRPSRCWTVWCVFEHCQSNWPFVSLSLTSAIQRVCLNPLFLLPVSLHFRFGEWHVMPGMLANRGIRTQELSRPRYRNEQEPPLSYWMPYLLCRRAILGRFRRTSSTPCSRITTMLPVYATFGNRLAPSRLKTCLPPQSSFR
jgi:hypothetical protein